MSMNRREILRLIGLGAPAAAVVSTGYANLDAPLLAVHKAELAEMQYEYSLWMEYYDKFEHMDEDVAPEVNELGDAITRKRGYVETMEAGA